MENPSSPRSESAGSDNLNLMIALSDGEMDEEMLEGNYTNNE